MLRLLGRNRSCWHSWTMFDPDVRQIFVSQQFQFGALPSLGDGDPFKRCGKHLTLPYACGDGFSWLTLAREGVCLFPF